ncbi:MAG TPA: DNA-formamidopyrimidine glycosylase family protein [Clostridia bacterium]|nr:DNA-formamidopyrimidine glycosylase family protein [Clostridia bacterium]
MIELPEAITIAGQINDKIAGRQIVNVTAAHSPHKFAWYFGDPQGYHKLLAEKTIEKAEGYGGMIEIKAGKGVILFNDGVGVRYHAQGESRPEKHQLLIEFDDDSAVSALVQMYGGVCCFNDGDYDNKYYVIAKEKISPLAEEFNESYFDSLISLDSVQKLSAKAAIATEQRIPGLGNGVLQDILYHAKIHPKKKINKLSDEEKTNLFKSIKATLAEMTFKGGRDTERDLYGCLGGYLTKVSKNTVDKPCSICGAIIKKENYMGGSIYYCPGCQAV